MISIYVFDTIIYGSGMTRCHGYIVAKAMDVEVDTDKYYFERILVAY